MREGEIKKEGEQTQMGELSEDISREAVLNYCISEQAPGEKGKKDKRFISLLAFSFFRLSLVRIGPMLPLSSVAWTLWVATGETEPRWVQCCQVKAGWTPLSICNVHRSVQVSGGHGGEKCP